MGTRELCSANGTRWLSVKCPDVLAPNLLPLLGKGLLLGWSVAWPPGPINSEMIRRGLSRGFWPAYAVGLGACSGDFLWALAVTLGAGVVRRGRAGPSESAESEPHEVVLDRR